MTAFAVNNVQDEFERMKALGVKLTLPPTQQKDGPMLAIFDDTCGNLIQIFEL